MLLDNPNGAEPMALMGASDRRRPELLGGIAARLGSADPAERRL